MASMQPTNEDDSTNESVDEGIPPKLKSSLRVAFISRVTTPKHCESHGRESTIILALVDWMFIATA